MASNLKEVKTNTSVTTRVSEEKKQQKKLPAGAEIIQKTVRTETEEIENGFLIIKTWDIQYRAKGSEHTDWMYYSKKWYSKTDPLSITLNDKALADAFEEE